MRDDYADPRHHARLMTALRDRLGHALAGLRRGREDRRRRRAARTRSTCSRSSATWRVERQRGRGASTRSAHDLERIVAGRARHGAQAGLHAGRHRRAVLHRRLDRPAPAGRAPRRGVPQRAGRARRPLRERRDRPGLFAQRHFAGAARCAEAWLSRRAPRPSPRPSPRRCRVFSPATHMRPERIR